MIQNPGDPDRSKLAALNLSDLGIINQADCRRFRVLAIQACPAEGIRSPQRGLPPGQRTPFRSGPGSFDGYHGLLFHKSSRRRSAVRAGTFGCNAYAIVSSSSE